LTSEFKEGLGILLDVILNKKSLFPKVIHRPAIVIHWDGPPYLEVGPIQAKDEDEAGR
jgi:hypothetical protein